MESRTQRSRPTPRTQKKFEVKDQLFQDRPSQGQGQEWSRPRPRTEDQGMAWNEMENGIERKFRCGIWKMAEWNGRFQKWNGRQSSIPFPC